MEKRNDNERSSASKLLFGTFLTNGLVLSVGGAIFFFMGLNRRNSFGYQFHLMAGGTDYAGLIAIGGVLLILIGIGCIGVHLSKKKDNK